LILHARLDLRLLAETQFREGLFGLRAEWLPGRRIDLGKSDFDLLLML
jgi:hypothetical protein